MAHPPRHPASSDAHNILTQITHAFAWTHQANQPLSTGVSIGIATAPNDATDLATLFELADAALDHAQRAGGHQPRAATAKPTPAAPADVP
ncbi:MAG: diguanylate cyclase domain-containing protein [Solirubrobacteraceae bacterium]